MYTCTGLWCPGTTSTYIYIYGVYRIHIHISYARSGTTIFWVMVHNHPKHPGYVLHQMMFLTFGFHGLLEGTLVPKHFVIDPSSRNWWIIPQFYLLGSGWESRHKSTTLIEGVFFCRNLTPTQNMSDLFCRLHWNCVRCRFQVEQECT